MKRLKLMLSAVGILAVVGTALAFTAKPFEMGSVYCNSTCTDRIDFRVAASGVSNPCTGTIQEYVRISATQCVTSSGPFEAVAAGQ
jgi:hypothetical protein